MSWYVLAQSGLRHGGLAGLLVLALLLGTPSGVLARTLASSNASDQTLPGLEQIHHGEVTDETVLALRPPLPFREPQVGPIIKRTYADDVDRRTTAFIPQAGSLDRLTPVEFPEDEERWIRVDLSEQLVVAYEGNKPVRAFVVSTGLPGTPTVTGTFRIRTKVKEQTMSGGVGRNYYNLPGVKWVQYFYADYSFHGTYWHNDFGRPKSHGCVNMTNADAKWLFDWAGPEWDNKTIWFKSTADNPGTLVVVTE